MGAIQDPTPAMGPYTIEARRESFRLHRAGRPGDPVAALGPYDDGELYLPFTELPEILAALAQAASCAALAPAPRPTTEPDNAEVIARRWRVEVDMKTTREIRRGTLTISGPCWVSVEDREGAPHAHLEVPYTRLPNLRALLEPLRERHQ